MEVSHLKADEIDYELELRGFPTGGNVQEKRKVLRGSLQLLMVHDTSFVLPEYPFDTKREIEVCTQKLADLRKGVSECKDQNELKRLRSRLLHVIERVKRIPTEDQEDRAQICMLRGESLELMSDISDIKFTVVRELNPQGEPEVVQTEGADPHDVSFRSFSNHFGPGLPFVESGYNSSCNVSRWGIKFDGQSVNLNSFIERVEETATARNTNKAQLFTQSIDLFSGKALIWFRHVRSRVSSWDELVGRLRVAFQDRYLEKRMKEEIHNRTQGPDESVEMFIATVEGMFNRLSVKESEEYRVQVLMGNLQPEYHDAVLVDPPSTIDELTDRCRRVEDSRAYRLNFHIPLPATSSTVSPEFAYKPSCVRKVQDKKFSQVSSVASPPKQPIASIKKCWNCDEPGHVFSLCDKPRKRFCFKCGSKGVIIATCSNCNPKN